MTKRSLVILAILLIASLALSACGGGADARTPGTEDHGVIDENHGLRTPQPSARSGACVGPFGGPRGTERKRSVVAP